MRLVPLPLGKGLFYACFGFTLILFLFCFSHTLCCLNTLFRVNLPYWVTIKLLSEAKKMNLRSLLEKAGVRKGRSGSLQRIGRTSAAHSPSARAKSHQLEEGGRGSLAERQWRSRDVGFTYRWVLPKGSPLALLFALKPAAWAQSC